MLYLLPIVAALIGWITNFLAVKMLFHPREARKILFFTFHGVFPKRQKALADKLGDIVSAELISITDISSKIKEFASSDEVLNDVGKRIEATIRNKLVSTFPMLSMFLSDEMVEKVTSLFKIELQEFLEETSKSLGEKLENEIDIKKLVSQRVTNFSSQKLEELLNQLMKKEFRFIELIGAIIGFLIGCFQIAILSFSP
ncbi:MAG: DUF445 family protein [Verrucomicrobiota bacterium]|nr:DUF445 family protein [Verrucomicrobiota bacterium]